MSKARHHDTHPARLARHRAKAAAEGRLRVEVTVPSGDAPLVRAIAGALRAGGEDATRVRDSLAPIVSSGRARTGAELVAFLRTSPVLVDLEVVRDRSHGRVADLE